ncbi:MAG: DUF5667 domain-containing protein [Candidatus Buchananbacteria bacterium]
MINNLKAVKNLETIGRPEAAWVLSNREILMSQINPQDKKIEENSLTKYYYQYFSEMLQFKVLRPALMAVFVFGAYFGYSAITLTAQASLPGEAMYPIKVLGEKLQMATTFGDEGKVKLKMDFISRRGDELQQIARTPEDPMVKSVKISATVKQITEDVKDVKTQIDKMTIDASAASLISTAKVVDDKTLKVEKDIVDVHTSLSTEVKKEVAKDVKEAIAQTEVTGTQALSVMVSKSGEKEVKDANQAVSDKELVARVGDRIKNMEIAVEAAASEVNKIATGTAAIIMDKVTMVSSSTSASLTTTTLKDAMQAVSDQPKAAQDAVDEAKNLLDKKDFSSALLKIVEGKNIAADVFEKAPLLDAQIRTEIVSSTATSTAVK